MTALHVKEVHSIGYIQRSTIFCPDSYCVLLYRKRQVIIVRVKLFLCSSFRHRGECSCSLIHSYPDIRWRWVVSLALRPLYPRGRSFRSPLSMGLGGPSSGSGRVWEEKSRALAGNRTDTLWLPSPLSRKMHVRWSVSCRLPPCHDISGIAWSGEILGHIQADTGNRYASRQIRRNCAGSTVNVLFRS